jgi:GTP-binding protein
MKFVDEATLFVKAGNGGAGCVSFRRARFIPKGGPDGGDGGKGGDVIIVGNKSLISLLDFKYKRIYKAENGRGGGGGNKTGRSGSDLLIKVPVGTLVYDADSGELLADIVEDQQRATVAISGGGGKGNCHFVSPTHKVPYEHTDGGEGEERRLLLELKLMADVGITGLPNAGKSTLLSKLTAARPEVGDYPFTTLTPSLGVFNDEDRTVVIADIPGIIEGASTGKGLGLKFMRHIERTRTLLWVIDVSSPSVPADYETLYRELAAYKEEILRKDRIIILNKTDLVNQQKVDDDTAYFRRKGETVVKVSALTGEGLEDLRGLLPHRSGGIVKWEQRL